MNKPILSIFLLALASACTAGEDPVVDLPRQSAASLQSTDLQLATFAGGCFWCMEVPFETLPGVSAVISGYTAGPEANPTYKQVSAGKTGHTEAIQVHFDPSQISYGTLLEVFWRQIDPTDTGGQFVDRGQQYRPGIYYHDGQQKELALKSKGELEASGRFKKPVAIEIEALQAFYPAEDYHQDYFRKSPDNYKRYRKGSGRDQFLDQVWGDERTLPMPAEQVLYKKPDEATLREKLTDLQYEVTQNAATERSFDNEYWDNKRPGIYVDVVTGEPLFSSLTKFKSGTGWPSFWQPLVPENITLDTDYKIGYPRSEVRSKHGDSHLGHVFNDGPDPTGLRYCMNSAALRFVPAEDLADQGYGQFALQFEK